MELITLKTYKASKNYLDYTTRDLSLFLKNVNDGEI